MLKLNVAVYGKIGKAYKMCNYFVYTVDEINCRHFLKSAREQKLRILIAFFRSEFVPALLLISPH